MVLISHNNSPEVLQPGKQAFDFPSTPITPKLSAVLGRRLFAPSPVRRDHLNSALMQKLLIKTVAIVSFIAHKLVRRIPGKTTIDSCLNKLYFMGRSAFHMSGDRKPTSVCDCQDLGAFATLCLADSKTPFFAGAKQPSMNASRISIWPRSYRSSTSSWAMRWNIPSRTHCWNQRWHVWYGGYRWGRSFHGAPVRRIHRIPFITSRGSRGLRPRGSLSGVKDTIMGSIRFHCSFVISILILLHNQALMSRFILR
jgi:hypothetical protein